MATRKNTTRSVRVRQHNFRIIFNPAEEGGYTVTCPALPGLVTEGDTLAEARRQAQDAIVCYLESLQIDGLPIPSDKTRAEEIAVTMAA